MQASVEDVVYAVGDAFVTSSLGTSELLIAVLVALAFALSAIQTLARGRSDEDHWREHHRER
jgi:hypothetical protein